MKTALNNIAGAGLPALGVKRPWLVAVMNLLIAIAGFVAIFAIEVRELPDVDQPVVNVRANFPGASPETMDSEVTRILEGAVARVSGVKEVNSKSEEGSSRIRAVFNPNADVDRAAADVRKPSVGCNDNCRKTLSNSPSLNQMKMPKKLCESPYLQTVYRSKISRQSLSETSSPRLFHFQAWLTYPSLGHDAKY